MNPLGNDQPYVFYVGMRPKRKRDKQKPLAAVVIMSNSTDLAWGLFRKQEGYKWDIVELQPTNLAGKSLKRLGHNDRQRVGREHDRRYKQNQRR